MVLTTCAGYPQSTQHVSCSTVISILAEPVFWCAAAVGVSHSLSLRCATEELFDASELEINLPEDVTDKVRSAAATDPVSARTANTIDGLMTFAVHGRRSRSNTWYEPPSCLACCTLVPLLRADQLVTAPFASSRHSPFFQYAETVIRSNRLI